MRKYRLSYLQNGKLCSIDLSKLECLKNLDVYNIRTIDMFSSNFENIEDLNDFLIRNDLLDEIYRNDELQITIDAKIEGTKNYYNKPIFLSNKLVLKSDKDHLNASYIIKTIKNNIKNNDYMSLLLLNYKNKYQRAINKDGMSFILGCLNYIESNIERINNKKISHTLNEINEFEYFLNQFIEKTFYSVNKQNKKNVKDREVHDFIIINNEILAQIKCTQNLDKNRLNDKLNYEIEEEQEKEVEEEFLTKEDYDIVNCKSFNLKNPYEIGNLSDEDKSKFYSLQESPKKYMKKSDGEF